NAYVNRHNAHELVAFFAGIEKFPFLKQVKQTFKSNFPDYKSCPKEQYYYTYVKIVTSENFLHYCNLPKGVLPLHKNDTPVKEHLQEALEYASSIGKTKVHFTVSEEHLQKFEGVKNTSIAELE